MKQITAMGKYLAIGATLAIGTLALPGSASAAGGVTLSSLKGSWEMTLAGYTGCGQSAMEATFTLDATGNANHNMTLVGHGQCGDSTNSRLTFAITALSTNGSGTATLSCGYDCGWNLMIQVNADGNSFNAVDVQNPGNYVSGVAIRQQ